MKRAHYWSVGVALAALLVNGGCIRNSQCSSASDCFVDEYCQAGVCMERDDADADEPDTDTPDADKEPDADAPDTDAPDTDAPDTDAPDTDAPDSEEPDDNLIYEGTLGLESPAEVEAARIYTEVTGGVNFRVNVENYPSLELLALRVIHGQVTIDSLSTTESISLPALTHIGG